MEVLVQPLGKRLDVAGGENLLTALQKHDIPISYSCMAGRCGTCRCRVIDGDIHEAGGYAFHNADHSAQRHVLACQSVVTGNCTIEIPEPDEVVVHPARIVKATVTALADLTHDIRMIRLAPSKALSFSPGQYAMLQFTPDHIRPYSMARLASDGELEFHVRLVPDGRVTSYIRNTLKVGDAVRVSGPLGTSYLRTRNDDPILCIAGGTGLAPVLSIVRGAIAAELPNPIHVYFGVRSPRDAYGLDWLRELSQRHPRLRVDIVSTIPGDDTGLRTGLVTEAVAADFTDLQGWRAYLCGAPPMVDAATLLLRSKGVQPAHIYADAFYATGT
ncbi:Naphthalene 1,2-dioxygenase/salicylate 5-hydroxylase systems, ferredoxin--NAD(P)(+), reductase component [Cupriavidus laharis]|uniref:Naphthalene 1,2-dioxygenase/salicylate 5-hydroxylase systems, ferredoxin--NAD(P)(+), reductase component n=1 Tax=Cupriavidus laharis TaxID=151654 RepID=A0ABM8WK81_9BURK|nr:2Fe-2S iron-sulfur cluster-binding protein [Cupriavidus laharis]CAG9167738.1 Naphthalene 1,2-dioxygenase/salicylate 5-hydroxylase systems, ferredoxin--NAD(P)(+), reductase component [Cupriavidus laharis]